MGGNTLQVNDNEGNIIPQSLLEKEDNIDLSMYTMGYYSEYAVGTYCLFCLLNCGIFPASRLNLVNNFKIPDCHTPILFLLNG